MSVTVTQLVRGAKQPRGGYIKPSLFEVTYRNDGIVLNDNENIHATIVGTVVDYMTRFIVGNGKVDKAFNVSFKGAAVAEDEFGVSDAKAMAADYALHITKDLDPLSIQCACKLAAFDVYYRSPYVIGLDDFPCKRIFPDGDTVQNIRTMIERSVSFFNDYGPVKKFGTTIGCTRGLSGVFSDIYGDIDFLTEDTLWDFKVSTKKLDSKATLQLFIYYLMGMDTGSESGHPIFSFGASYDFHAIVNLGVFNPRLNIVYRLPLYRETDNEQEDNRMLDESVYDAIWHNVMQCFGNYYRYWDGGDLF